MMNNQLPDPLKHRTADFPIDPLFLKRWSPRAMSGAAVSQENVNLLLEAARWAPSSYNEQEWRFLYAHRDSANWPLFFDVLVEPNQLWCDRAGLLMMICGRKNFVRNNKPNKVHSFDCGAAFQNLALQGTMLGLVVHPMAGFHESKARQDLRIPAEFQLEAMVAVGHPGDPARLPQDYQSLEIPSGRKPISQISCEGLFSFQD